MSPRSTRAHTRRAKHLPRPGISNASPTRDGRGTLPSRFEIETRTARVVGVYMPSAADVARADAFLESLVARRRCPSCGADVLGDGCPFCGVFDTRAEVDA